MKIVVTGCDGQLGKQIIKQINKENKTLKNEIFALNREKLDICDIDKVNSYILSINPDIIINCAAFTKVDLCEDEVELAYKVNSIGPKNLAICCEKVNAKLVHISTDYVFDGNKNIYREDDITNPQSVYGKSKLLGEQYVQSFCSKYFIIRTAWLYGDGNNFVKTILNLSESNNEINVVNDQIGTPTSTKDLAEVILKLIHTENYGLYHGTNKGSCSWYEFAKKIFEIKNIDIKVNPISSNEYSSKVKRPQYSVLDNFLLRTINLDDFREWEEALSEYLNIN